jgi:hypothetical protein
MVFPIIINPALTLIPSVMAGKLILVTRGTGLIGTKTIQLALKAGCSVRAAIRSQAKANAVLATPTIKAIKLGSRLTFVLLSLRCSPKARTTKSSNESHNLHIASTTVRGEGFAEDQFEKKLTELALNGTPRSLPQRTRQPAFTYIVITS